MDTHICPDPDLAAPLSASLPEERFPAGGDAPDPATDGAPTLEERLPSSEPLRGKRRHGLLLGVAAVALAGIGSGAFLISPYNHVMPVPAAMRNIAGTVGVKVPPPLAPSAALAKVSLPSTPESVIRERYHAAPADAQLRELLALDAGQKPAAAAPPARETRSAELDGPPPGYVPREPGTEPPPAAATVQPAPAPAPGGGSKPDLTASVLAGMGHLGQPAQAAAAAPATSQTAPAPSPAPTGQPAQAAPAPVAATTVASTKPVAKAAPAPGEDADPVTVAQVLQAAPMLPPQQVQVLELVTEVATVVRDQRTELAELRSDFAKARAEYDARIEDLRRRLAMAEARKAVSAMAVDPPALLAPAPVTMAAVAPSTPAIVRPAFVTLGPAPADAADNVAGKRYRVQAASPGLAMLAEVDRGGGEGAQIQVTVGDTLPGYGRVRSIAQKGTVWVVTTENGAIGQ